jgi:hypothetical protein
MTNLTTLADRVEAAERGDWELDSDIHSLISPDRKHPYLVGTHIDDTHPSGRPYSAPAYTASIDAAMTLVPEGWTYVSIEFCARGMPGQHCRVSIERLITEHDDEREYGYAATPALALCAAALRAQAKEKPC